MGRTTSNLPWVLRAGFTAFDRWVSSGRWWASQAIDPHAHKGRFHWRWLLKEDSRKSRRSTSSNSSCRTSCLSRLEIRTSLLCCGIRGYLSTSRYSQGISPSDKAAISPNRLNRRLWWVCYRVCLHLFWIVTWHRKTVHECQQQFSLMHLLIQCWIILPGYSLINLSINFDLWTLKH